MNVPIHSQTLRATTNAEEQGAPRLGGARVSQRVRGSRPTKDHLARYEFVSSECVGKHVLDIATGTGYGANILRDRGAARVVAVDRERAALEYAAVRYDGRGIEWVEGEAYALPFQEPFDTVVSFDTVEHLEHPERFVAECRRLLKPAGTFIVSTPLNAGGSLSSEQREHEFSRDGFETLLRRYFSRVEIWGQRRELCTVLKPLGSFPERYRRDHVNHRPLRQKLGTALHQINQAPNLLAAWAMGHGDSFRSQISRIDAPTLQSPLLLPHYSIMIAKCTHPNC